MPKKGNIPWDKGIKRPEISGKNHPLWGKHHSLKTKEKMSKAKKDIYNGENHPNWKGGIKIEKQGYISLYMPKHPFCINKRYVLRSRLVMEKYLSRYLTFKEIVHHKNEIVTDDRIENLQLCSGTAEHRHLHKKS